MFTKTIKKIKYCAKKLIFFECLIFIYFEIICAPRNVDQAPHFFLDLSSTS